MASRFAFRRRKKYASWLGLASHEFFHAWNVKRSRPEGLGPFDYEREVYTRALWVAEGITNYYTDLVPRRSGVTTTEEYLEFLSDLIDGVQNTPGRRLHSLEDSSFDAWIKFYRPDENTANTTVNYYIKGAVVAWLLDVEIRKRTDGKRSLDDLMRLLFARYSGERGFTGLDVQACAEETAGGSLESLFACAVRGREELDYAEALTYLGLRFRGKDEGLGKDPPPVWLGIDTKNAEGRLVVTKVRRDGPAWEAGLNAEDEVLAVGGYRVTPESFKERLLQYRAGDRLEILLARREAVLTIPIVPAAAPGSPWRLIVDPDAPPAATAAREAWLAG
jgi:predicted metalloprotease with PDZ domain